MKLRPSKVESEPATGAIARLLRTPGVAAAATRLAWGSGPFTWAINDSADSPLHLPDAGDSAIHLLHSHDEDRSSILIDGVSFAAKPGDSILYSAGERPVVTPRQLFVTMHVAGTSPRHPRRATHGTESFTGYNRRTMYDRTPYLDFDRWKLSQPLRLQSDVPCPVLTIFGKIGIVEGSHVYTLHAGESMVFTGAIDLLPDGLAYCMTMWEPLLGYEPLSEVP